MEHKLTEDEMRYLTYLDSITKEVTNARQVFVGYLQLKYHQHEVNQQGISDQQEQEIDN
jgi:hypothetical protein